MNEFQLRYYERLINPPVVACKIHKAGYLIFYFNNIDGSFGCPVCKLKQRLQEKYRK